MLALSIFTCSRPHTIVDEPELNFCVRDGNRWTLRPINTNFPCFLQDHGTCQDRTSNACPYILFSDRILKTEHSFSCNYVLSKVI